MSDEDDNDTNPGIELPREKTTISTAPAAPVRATPLPPQRQRGVPSSAAAAAFPAPAMRAGFAVRPSAAPPPMKPAAPPPLPRSPIGSPSPSMSPSTPMTSSSAGTSPSAAPPSAPRPPSAPPAPEPAPEPSAPVDYLSSFEPTPSRLNELPELPPAMTLVGHRAPEPKVAEPAPPVVPAAAAAPIAAPAPAPVVAAAPSRGTIPPTASASPSLLIPKPALGAAAVGGDPRVTQVEVQLQAVRAQLSRAEVEVQTAVKRAEAAEQRASSYAGRIEALEAALAVAQASLGSRIDDVAERADKPVATRPLEERIEKVERMRAELTAAQHELAEHGRLFESRKARVDSLETRVGRLESDTRFTEIRRPIESLDLRMSAIEAGRDAPLVAVRAEIEALVARVAELEARAEAPPTAPPTARRRTTASHEKVEGSLEGIKGLGPKTKKQLKELGVTDASQIAAWTEADLARFSEELGTAKKKLEAWVLAAKAAR